MVAFVLNELGTAACCRAEQLLLVHSSRGDVDGLIRAVFASHHTAGLVPTVRRALAATSDHKGRPQMISNTICEAESLAGYRFRSRRRMIVRKELRQARRGWRGWIRR